MCCNTHPACFTACDIPFSCEDGLTVTSSCRARFRGCISESAAFCLPFPFYGCFRRFLWLSSGKPSPGVWFTSLFRCRRHDRTERGRLSRCLARHCTQWQSFFCALFPPSCVNDPAAADILGRQKNAVVGMAGLAHKT
jgi:hypothetical protein